MNYITFAEVEDLGRYSNVSVYYYDEENPKGVMAAGVTLLQKTDANGRKYYVIKLPQAVTANKLRLGFARGNNYRNIVIAEGQFLPLRQPGRRYHGPVCG